MRDSRKVTFVLPGRRRSGGVLATVAMGNELLRRGYDVRIAWRGFPLVSAQSMRRAVKRVEGLMRLGRDDDGLVEFEGRMECFLQLESIVFSQGERVIAVGSMTVGDVRRLSAPVIKMRYCHGFTPHDEALMQEAWGFAMPTLSVSASLVGRLEALSGQGVLGVVSNGIDGKRFYPEPGVARDGIGVIYGDHVSKDPETLVELLGRVRQRWPSVRRYAFGQARRPACLTRSEYTRMPDPDKVRRIYNHAKVWVVPSRSEGFGLPILEAMACGAAVVSTRTEGALELIRHEENGLLVNVGDVEGFMESIDRLLGDEGARQRLVEQGLRTVARYRWASAADQLEGCFAGMNSMRVEA